MNFKFQKITSATTLLVILAMTQVYVGVTFAEPNSSPPVSEAAPAQLMGILTTSNNKPITINGANAISGATIPTGAAIETPDKVGATIRLGLLGSICIAPNSKVTIEFDQQQNAGAITVRVSEGCVILSTKKDTTGTVITSQGTAGQIGPATAASIDVCLRAGSAPAVNQGAAVDAGAGASALDCGAAGAAAAPTGFPLGAKIAIIAYGGAGLYGLIRGQNPSPSRP
jgi:hypothetical protein